MVTTNLSGNAKYFASPYCFAMFRLHIKKIRQYDEQIVHKINVLLFLMNMSYCLHKLNKIKNDRTMQPAKRKLGQLSKAGQWWT